LYVPQSEGTPPPGLSAAADAFRRALAANEVNGIEDGRKVSIHDALAEFYLRLGQFANASSEYRRALALSRKIDGGNSLTRGILFAKLVSVTGEEGNDPGAILQLREAIRLDQRTASDDQLALMRVSLAQLLTVRKNYRAADGLLVEAVADFERRRTLAPNGRQTH
jgi:tetratricopeptide (TPR) repeat protein